MLESGTCRATIEFKGELSWLLLSPRAEEKERRRRQPFAFGSLRIPSAFSFAGRLGLGRLAGLALGLQRLAGIAHLGTLQVCLSI